MEEPISRKIGYARISTYDQNLDLQIDALKEVVAKRKIFLSTKYQGQKQNVLDWA